MTSNSQNRLPRFLLTALLTLLLSSVHSSLTASSSVDDLLLTDFPSFYSWPEDMQDIFRQLYSSLHDLDGGMTMMSGGEMPEGDGGEPILSGSEPGDHSFGFSMQPDGSFQVYEMAVNPDRSVTLRWEGPSDRVFNVEVSRNLVDWKTVAQDHPSDGGLSLWTDAGNPFAIDPVEHPADADRRFYRIREGDELPFTLPSGTVTLASYDADSGVAVFDIDVDTSGGQTISEVALLISGIQVGEAYTPPYQIEVDTTRLWNGEHEVCALVIDGLAIDPPTGESGGTSPGEAPGSVLTPPINFNIDNLLSSFRVKHPIFSPDEEGHVQEVSARLQDVSEWTVEVISMDTEAVVWSTSGESQWIFASWDGLDMTSQPIPPGRYSVEISIPEPLLAAQSGSGQTASGGWEPWRWRQGIVKPFLNLI